MARPKGSKNKVKATETKEVADNVINPQDKFFVPRIYARSQIQPLWQTIPQNSTTKEYTSEQISKLLLNPYINYKELQSISKYLLYNSPLYNNFLDYVSNILTWDYVLMSEELNPTVDKYIKSAKTIYKINVKTVFPTHLKSALANGEAYFYNMSDNSNTIIIEIDSDICQLAQIDSNNIWRYYVDVTKILPTKVYELPDEIREYYNEWVNGGKKKSRKDKKVIDGIEIPTYLYPVSSKGFAVFAHMRKMQHDYPYFASMFEDLNNLESDKDYMSDYIKDSNTKLIHMTVPTDEKGTPLIDRGTVEAYHNSAKEHLPRSVCAVTNPFETEGITLDSSQRTAINSVEHSTKIAMQDSGISEAIFNANSTLGLQFSTLADASKIYPLLYYFENFVNFQIKEYKHKIRFLKINQFNQFKWHERYYADVQAGGSRTLFAVTGGIEPYEIVNLAKTEKAIAMDELLEPKMNSSQLSADDLSNANGRPPKEPDDAADTTNQVNEGK